MLRRLGTEGKFLTMMRVYMKKTTANIVLSGERLKAFPLRSEKEDLLSQLPFSIVLEVLPQSYKARKGNKGHPQWKGNCKTMFLQLT